MGDYNITTNLTLYASGQYDVILPVIEYEDSYSSSTVDFDKLEWFDAPISTSNCWAAWIRFTGPGQGGATGTFSLDVSWTDPETGQSRTNTDVFDWAGHRVNTNDLCTFSPRFNITNVSSDTTVSVSFMERQAANDDGDIYVIDMYIPPGFAHGFCVLSDTAIFSYKCTAYYDQPSEGGVLWNDPDIAIDWPLSDPLLSDKDAKYTNLKDIDQNSLPRYEGTNG